MQQYGFCLVPHHSSLTNNVSFCPSPPLFVLAGGPSHVHQLRHRPPRPRSQRHAQAVEVAAHRQQPQRPGRQLTCWLAAPWAPPPSQDEGCQASPWIPPAPRPTSHGSLPLLPSIVITSFWRNASITIKISRLVFCMTQCVLDHLLLVRCVVLCVCMSVLLCRSGHSQCGSTAVAAQQWLGHDQRHE